MRTALAGLVTLGLVLGLAAPHAVAQVKTDTWKFDVYEGKRKVGSMRLKIMTVRNVAILDTEFAAPFRVRKGGTMEAGFDSQVVYRGDKQPEPQSGKVTTRLGGFKLMTGSFEVKTLDGTRTAKCEATGFADKERKPFETSRTWEKQLPMPAGLVLTHAALLYYAPKLLPQPGKIENVAQMEFPDDIGWPELVNLTPDCVLQRRPINADGEVEFTLHRELPGGNINPLLTMKTDRDGRVLESTLGGRFLIRPEGEGEQEETGDDAK